MEGELELDLLLSVAGGLGKWQYVDEIKRVYIKDDDCVACLKDLQRFLRRDDPDLRDVFFKIGELQLVENDIVPLLTVYPTDHELVYQALKVLAFMTMPVDPNTADMARQYAILASIKAVCCGRDLLASLMSLAAGPLSRHPHMTDKDHQALQLLLTFFRNLVSIPDPAVGASSSAPHSTLQVELLLRLFDESVMELVLLVSSHANERAFKADAPLLLDTLAEVYSGIDVTQVLDVDEEAVSKAKRHQQRMQLAEARRSKANTTKTIAQQLLQGKQLTRHGRFCSTIVATHKDSAAQIYIHNPGQQGTLQTPAIELETKVRGPATKNVSPALLLALRNYTTSFLQGAYNVLIGHLLPELKLGGDLSRLEQGDFTKWFQLAAWFSRFVRLQQERLYEAQYSLKQQGTAATPAAAAGTAAGTAQESRFGCINATLDGDTFHVAQKAFLEQSDKPSRSDMKDWALLHAASSLLREALGCIELAGRAGTRQDKRQADRLARKLLHDTTRESGLLFSLTNRVKTFSARHEPRTAAVTLIEALHVVLRLYDRLTAREDGKFLVKAKKRTWGGAGRRHKTPAAQPEEAAAAATAEGVGNQDKRGTAAATADSAGQQNKATANEGKGMAAVIAAGNAGAPAAVHGQADTGERCTAPEAGLMGEPAAASNRQANSSNSQQGHASAGQCATSSQAAKTAAATAAAAATATQALPSTAANAAVGQAGEGGSIAAPGQADSLQQEEQQQQRDSPAAGGANGSNSDAEGSEAGGANAAATGTAGAANGPHRNVLDEIMAEEGASEGEDDEGEGRRYHEVAFDLKHQIRQYMAVPAVVQFYMWMLAGCNNTNTPALNHAICSFLWRIILPEHLDLEPLLYQLSFLRVFHQLLSDASLRKKMEHREVLLLCTRVVRGLFSRLVPQPSLLPPEQQQQRQNKHNAGHSDQAATIAEEGNVAKQTERELRRQEAVAGMLCVDLMFWRNANICDYINKEYHLREEDQFVSRAAAGNNAWRGAGKDGGAVKGMPGRSAGARAQPAQPALLNPAGEEKLKQLFEGLCADRANLDTLARQLGGRLTPKQVARELRRLRLKFGALPESLLPRLHQLYQQHKDLDTTAAMLQAIAQDLPGSWTDKQVGKLLRSEGLLGGGGGNRRLKRHAGVDDSAGWNGGDHDAQDLADSKILLEVDKERLEGLYQQHIVQEDYLDQIAAALQSDGQPVSAADVLATLRFHGVVAKKQQPAKKKRRNEPGAGRGRLVGGGESRRISKGMLQSLLEQHGSDADGLNIVAMLLDLSVLEVQRLLVKHNLSEAAMSRRNAGDAAAKRTKKRSRNAELEDNIENDELAGGASGRQVATAAGPCKSQKLIIPEPQPMQLLGYLEAMQRSHKDSHGRWLDAAAAVAWLLGKLDAAEAVWDRAATATAGVDMDAKADYCLVPSGEEDLNFFCSDWSNEVLEAAGVQNDSGDYFKISGNSSPAWRNRVRAALNSALQLIGSDQAAKAADVVLAEAEEAAAAAEAEQARIRASGGAVGFGANQEAGGSGKDANKSINASAAQAAAAEMGKGLKQSIAARDAAVSGGKRRIKHRRPPAADSSEDGWDSSSSEAGQANDADGAVAANRPPAARHSVSTDAGSSSGTGSDGGMDIEQGGGSSSDKDHGMPQYDSSSDDAQGSDSSGAAHKLHSKAAAVSRGRRVAKAEAGVAAAGKSRNGDVGIDSSSSGSDIDNEGLPVPTSRRTVVRSSSHHGSNQGAPRTALQEITRRRQQQQQQQRQLTAAKPAHVSTSLLDMISNDADGGDDAGIDENRSAAAIEAAGGMGLSSGPGAVSGQAAMVLLDDSDDDD